MKIRIQDHSVRFRVSVREAEMLLERGEIEAVTEIRSPDTGLLEGSFVYGVRRADGAAESECRIRPGSIRLVLTRRDCERLLEPDREGVYLAREAVAEDGSAHRFLAMVEKDRPAAKCGKPEKWIYDHGAPNPSLVDIRPGDGAASKDES